MRFFYFLIFSFQAVVGFSAVPIDLDKIKEEYLLVGKDFDFFEDATKQYSFDQIKEKEDQLFSPDHRVLETVTHVESNYWVRFNLKSTNTTPKMIFEVLTPQTESLSFFIPKLNGTYERKDVGYLLPFLEREYEHKNFIFDFQANTDFSKPFYIKVHSSNKVGLLFKIRNQQYFTKYSLNEYLVLGLYYGFLLILIVYNLILFIYLKKRVYLAYILAVISAIGLSLSDDGLGFAYIWSNYPSWSQVLGLDIFPIAFLLSYTFYAITFINNQYKKLQQVILYSTAAYLLYFLVVVLFSSQKFYYSLAYSFPFLVIYLSYLLIVYEGKFKPARFFVVGNTFALFGVIIEQLRLLEIIPGNLFTVYAFELGMVLEFLSLSFSLAYSYSQESKQRIVAQSEKIDLLQEQEIIQQEKFQLLEEKEALAQKVNKELEGKVQERTEELTDVNEKLQKLVTNLESMSITLDKENWQLKRVIKQEKKDRLTGNAITLDEVKLVYPTKISCLKLLEQLKWKTDFSCNKCGYEKFSINEKNRSRKCSKCGKIESVTSGSLFHAQKIPLQELFLLTHLAFKQQKMDVSELSKELNISETSLYKFIKKVKDKKEEKPKAKSWEDLIF